MDLDDVRRDWTRLGEADPLWAVYVAPGKRGGGWDLEEFFATGEAEVSTSLAQVTSLGLTPGHEVALDFGVGVGRLSNALATRFAKVIGVDVSPPMLDQARQIDRSEGRIEFVLNEQTDLSFQPDASVDLVYSSLVLQHLPADLAAGYLREFVRVLAPGGVAVVQAPTTPLRNLKGMLFRFAPFGLVAFLQTRLLRYPAPMRMTPLPPDRVTAALAGTGARVVAAVPDTTYGGHWQSLRYFIVRG